MGEKGGPQRGRSQKKKVQKGQQSTIFVTLISKNGGAGKRQKNSVKKKPEGTRRTEGVLKGP